VSPEKRHGALLSWRAASLPCFTLWKNQGGLADGYVTGLEPGTNYPNPRSVEERHGRIVPLAANQSVRFDLSLEHLAGSELAAARERLSVAAAPRIHSQPRPDWG